MADLSQGAHANLILEPGDVFRVSTSGVATVLSIYGAPAGTTTLTARSQDFGPYSVPAKLRVDAMTGAAFYCALVESETRVNRDASGFPTSLIDSVSGKKVGFRANKLLAAIRAARAGVGPLLICMLGDSNTAGAGAGTSTAGMVGAQRWSVGAQLADILDRTFMPTSNDAFFGDQNAGDSGVTLQQFDPRFSALGAGWTQLNGPTLGRKMFQGAAGGAGALTFTPRKPWNRVRILCGANNTCATTTNVKAGGSTVGNLNTFTAGPNALSDQTFSTGAAAAVQAFSLDGVAGGTTFLCGAIFWDSDNPGCVVVSAGWFGGFASQLNDATLPWSPRPVAVALGAGLYIGNATINDANSPTAVSAFKASSLGFYQAVGAVGDVLITGMTPSSTPSTATLDAYEGALQEVAAAIGSAFPLIDWRDQVGATYTAANASGWMYDGNHLKGVGYAQQAALEAELISSVIQSV